MYCRTYSNISIVNTSVFEPYYSKATKLRGGNAIGIYSKFTIENVVIYIYIYVVNNIVFLNHTTKNIL